MTPGVNRLPAAVLRRTFGPVKQHGPAVLFQHRHLFCGIVDDRDPQIGEYRGRYIQIAVGPEGHGGICHRQNTFLCRHEIHTARRFGRKSQLKQQQAAQQTHGPSAFSSAVPPLRQFFNKTFYHICFCLVKSVTQPVEDLHRHTGIVVGQDGLIVRAALRHGVPRRID